MRVRRALLGALAMTAALVVTAAPVAHAAPGGSAAAEPCDYETDPNRCNYLYLYPEADYAGEPEQIPHQPDNTCADLASPLNQGLGSLRNGLGNFGHRKATSTVPGQADTPGQAVLLYAGAGCTGASYRFSAGSYSRDLAALGFPTALSVQFVQDPCEVYVDADGKRRNLNVCVYADADDAGTAQAFPSQAVNTCLPLQSSLLGQVSAVRNNLYDEGPPKLQQDVITFAGDNCTGKANRTNASTGHPVLASLGFDNQARSIKFVVNACTSYSSLCLWSNEQYDGAVQIITTQPEGACVNLSAALAGQVSSFRNQLRNPQSQDVSFFTGAGCTGTSKRFGEGEASSNLQQLAFNDKTRSIRFLADSCRWGDSLCLYTDAYHVGEAQVFRSPAPNSCVNLRSGISGQVSSLRNWLTDLDTLTYYKMEVAVYTGTGCTGTTRTLWAGGVDYTLSGTPFQDSIKSVRFLPA